MSYLWIRKKGLNELPLDQKGLNELPLDQKGLNELPLDQKGLNELPLDQKRRIEWATTGQEVVRTSSLPLVP